MLLFHHDPLHSDDYLDAFSGSAIQRWDELGGTAAALEMAVEGRELEVGPLGVASRAGV